VRERKATATRAAPPIPQIRAGVPMRHEIGAGSHVAAGDQSIAEEDFRVHDPRTLRPRRPHPVGVPGPTTGG
jgi:hypothetical protein